MVRDRAVAYNIGFDQHMTNQYRYPQLLAFDSLNSINPHSFLMPD